ncbi:MAG: C4-dicarboxylate TRAP transporter substrate-binding protein [Oscillospiraceae bacterium]|nr:C4-dicarboxylate TRAP transporter substrate-binding protein [Oscillospiraceae bacterium]
MKKVIAAMIPMLLLLSLTACGAGSSHARVYTLKMSTQLNETHPLMEGLRQWAENVEEKTNGGLMIEVFPSGQFGYDEDVIEQAILGANVGVLSDGGRMSNYVHEIGIIGMAYIADSYDEALKITQTETFAEWERQLADEDGLRILSFNWYDGARHFLTNKPATNPDELKGLRIRTPGSPVWTMSVEALGATPISMGWGDSYNALQTGAIEGVEAQNTASYGARMFEVVKYINKTSHFHLINGVVVGEKWFKNLPEEYQGILVDECIAAAAENARYVEGVSDDYEQRLIDNGMEVIEVDMEAFRLASEKAYERLGFSELRTRLYEEIQKDDETVGELLEFSELHDRLYEEINAEARRYEEINAEGG